MGGGLTRIEVEPYESEGHSYELCRSERNSADNNKKKTKNSLFKHNVAARMLQSQRQKPESGDRRGIKDGHNRPYLNQRKSSLFRAQNHTAVVWGQGGKKKNLEEEPQRERSHWRRAIDAIFTENVNVRSFV